MPSENVVNASVDYVQWFGEKKSCQMNLEEVSVSFLPAIQQDEHVSTLFTSVFGDKAGVEWK